MLLWQKSRNGESKLVVGCLPTRQPVFGAYLQPPPNYVNDRFVFRIDGVDCVPQSWEILNEGRWVEIGFMLTSNQVARLPYARTVGARMIHPSGDIFFGFEKTLNSDKLAKMLKGCRVNFEQIEPSASAGSPNVESSSGISTHQGFGPPEPDTDFVGGDLLRMGVQDVNFGECVKICSSMPDCKAISGVAEKKWCWPKMVDE